MSWLTRAERHALRGICAGLTGAGPDGNWTAAVAEGVATAIEQAARASERTDFRRALRLLNHPLPNGLLARTPKRLSRMTQPERERVLRAWANSPIGLLRQGFQTFKRLALFHEYALASGEAGGNPNWELIGYPGPPAPGASAEHTRQPGEGPVDGLGPLDEQTGGASEWPEDDSSPPLRRAPLQALRIAKETTLRADVVVVGSGAGGAVVAAELAGAGAQVLVLEKGGLRQQSDFDGAEYAAMRDLYEKRGILTSADVGVVVLAGSTVGGGTTVNWTTSLPTPDYVLQQWDEQLGVSAATGASWQASQRAVSERLVLNTASAENRQNALLRQAAEALGYRWRQVPRNVHGCQDCGYCGFGCRYGAKQSALVTYLLDAQRAGAQIVPDCYVERLISGRGRVGGVEARVNGHALRVESPTVVVAAGSVHSPALLLRSGLSNPNIGRHLHLHPVPAAFGIFDEPVGAWRGTMQCVAVEEFMDLDRGYGFAVEVPPVHPGLLALGVPWQSAHSHRELMRQAAHMGFFFALVRDRDGGRVTVDREGRPVVHYRLSAYDSQHVLHGAAEIVRLLAAAGAHTVGGPANSLEPEKLGEAGALDRRLEAIRRSGYRPNDMTLYSAHQMSSCRMAGSARQGVVDPEGQSYELAGLYVADASALPSSTGVNPMISIMTLAHHVAQAIKQDLR